MTEEKNFEQRIRITIHVRTCLQVCLSLFSTRKINTDPAQDADFSGALRDYVTGHFNVSEPHESDMVDEDQPTETKEPPGKNILDEDEHVEPPKSMKRREIIWE
jgi:hypothetical protein